MRNRFITLAGGATAAALLAACAAPVQQPVATYPSQPVYPSVATTPAPGTYPSAGVATAPAATEWGRVTDIQAVQTGQTSATNPNVNRAVVGGIIGAVVGNIVGKNVNNGNNRSAATVLGAAGGAAIGHRNDQNAATANTAAPAYRVSVQTDQGQWRTYEVSAVGDLRVGDRVRVENGVIYRS